MAVHKVSVELVASSKNFDRDLDKFTRKLDKVNKNYQKQAKTMKEIARQEKIISNYRKTHGQGGGVGGGNPRTGNPSGRGVGRNRSMIGYAGVAGAAAVVGSAAIYGAGSVLTGGARRQASRTQIENMMGSDLSTKQIGQLNEISNVTGQGKDEVYTAIYDYLSTYGGDLDSALGSAMENAMLATGGGASLGDVQGAAISIKKAFDSLSNKEVAQLIAGGVQAGRVTVGQVAQNVGEFMPIAAAQGIKADDAMAVYAAATQSLGNANTASTAVKGLFNKLVTEKTGITEEDLKTKDFGQIIDKLNVTMKEYISKGDAAGNIEALSKIFGTEEGAKAFLAISDKENYETVRNTVQSADQSKLFENSITDTVSQFNRVMQTSSTLVDTLLTTSGAFTTVSSLLQSSADAISGANETISLNSERKGKSKTASELLYEKMFTGNESKQALEMYTGSVTNLESAKLNQSRGESDEDYSSRIKTIFVDKMASDFAKGGDAVFVELLRIDQQLKQLNFIGPSGSGLVGPVLPEEQ